MTVDILVDPVVSVSPIVPDLLSAILCQSARLEVTFPRGEWSLAVRLTSDTEIGRLHDQHFGDPSPTDVITFPFDDTHQLGGHLGDIVISVDTAEANARSVGHSTAREIAFLGVHGLLHLCGYGDGTSSEREAMLDRQEALLTTSERALGIQL
jgi:probable rRNA maturation factor